MTRVIALQLYMSKRNAQETGFTSAVSLGVGIVERVELYYVGHVRVLYYGD